MCKSQKDDHKLIPLLQILLISLVSLDFLWMEKMTICSISHVEVEEGHLNLPESSGEPHSP